MKFIKMQGLGNDYVYVDTFAQQVRDPAALAVTLTREDGSGENAFGYLDPLSSVAAFGLRPGENDIEYVPTGDRSRSVIRVRWYDTFEGV